MLPGCTAVIHSAGYKLGRNVELVAGSWLLVVGCWFGFASCNCSGQVPDAIKIE